MTESTVSEVVESQVEEIATLAKTLRNSHKLCGPRKYEEKPREMKAYHEGRYFAGKDLWSMVVKLRTLLSTIKAGKEGQDYRPELPCADAGSDIPRSPEGWRLIESAPTNTSVLVFIENADHYGHGVYRAMLVDMGTVRRWMTSGLHIGRDCGTHDQPTHWMPLPEAPSSMAARDIGARAPQGADDASGSAPKPVSQPDHAPGEGGTA